MGPSDKDEPPVPVSASRAEPQARTYSPARMEAFSDGVFAFAITLLVLDLVVPKAEGSHDLLRAFLAEWPQYLAYVVSFATIGAIWLAHNAITNRLRHVTPTFLRLNLLLMMLVAFIPFPTRFLSEYINTPRSETIAVAIYGIAFLVLTCAVLLLWWYARIHGLLSVDPEDVESSVYTQRLLPGIAVYVVLIVLGFFAPVAAVAGYLVLALYFIVPLRLRRRPSPPGAADPSAR